VTPEEQTAVYLKVQEMRKLGTDVRVIARAVGLDVLQLLRLEREVENRAFMERYKTRGGVP
jgi:hypothetical protein